MLDVRCAPPVKELGATGKTADRCVLLLQYVVVAAVLLLLLLFLMRLKNINVQQRVANNGTMGITISFVAGYLRKKQLRGFSCKLLGSAKFESNPLLFRANSATFNSPRTATVLGREPRHESQCIHAPLAPPAAERASKNPRSLESSMPENKMHIIHIHTRLPFGMWVM